MKPERTGAFAKNLEFLRKQKGWSQERLATELTRGGVFYTRARIGAWEEGRNEPWSYVLADVAKYFGISMDELYNKPLKPDRIYER